VTPDSDHARVFIPPPLIYIGVFLVGIALQALVPLPWIPVGLGRVLGPALVVVGIFLASWGVKHFWSSRTSVMPMRPTTTLVRHGPYRFTRNPMYLGFLLVYAGVACWLGFSWPLLLAPVLIWIIAVGVIGREESYLNRKFGHDYREYQSRVRRWL